MVGLVASIIQQAVEDIRAMSKEHAWRCSKKGRSAYNARVRDFRSAVEFFRRQGSPFEWMAVFVGLDVEVVRERLEPELVLAESLEREVGAHPSDPA